MGSTILVRALDPDTWPMNDYLWIAVGIVALLLFSGVIMQIFAVALSYLPIILGGALIGAGAYYHLEYSWLLMGLGVFLVLWGVFSYDVK